MTSCTSSEQRIHDVSGLRHAGNPLDMIVRYYLDRTVFIIWRGHLSHSLCRVKCIPVVRHIYMFKIYTADWSNRAHYRLYYGHVIK